MNRNVLLLGYAILALFCSVEACGAIFGDVRGVVVIRNNAQ